MVNKVLQLPKVANTLGTVALVQGSRCSPEKVVLQKLLFRRGETLIFNLEALQPVFQP